MGIYMASFSDIHQDSGCLVQKQELRWVLLLIAQMGRVFFVEISVEHVGGKFKGSPLVDYSGPGSATGVGSSNGKSDGEVS